MAWKTLLGKKKKKPLSVGLRLHPGGSKTRAALGRRTAREGKRGSSVNDGQEPSEKPVQKKKGSDFKTGLAAGRRQRGKIKVKRVESLEGRPA